MSEELLYKPISDWLFQFLKYRYKRFEIIVEDTHKIRLSDFLFKRNIHKFFPAYKVYDIKVDITGVILNSNSGRLVFVECKTKQIKLLDVGQLLGYSLVARPIYSFLISPQGISAPLFLLIKNYGRYDILGYSVDKRKDRKIILCQWDESKKDINWNNIIPPGSL
jgi:hypothetical protein